MNKYITYYLIAGLVYALCYSVFVFTSTDPEKRKFSQVIAGNAIVIPLWPFYAVLALVAWIAGVFYKSHCIFCGKEVTRTDAQIKAHYLVCEKHPGNRVAKEQDETIKVLAKELLRIEMMSISWQAYGCQWTLCMEYVIWDICLKRSGRKIGEITLSKEVIAKLVNLSKLSGGWYALDPASINTAKFYEAKEWVEMFANRRSITQNIMMKAAGRLN